MRSLKGLTRQIQQEDSSFLARSRCGDIYDSHTVSLDVNGRESARSASDPNVKLAQEG